MHGRGRHRWNQGERDGGGRFGERGGLGPGHGPPFRGGGRFGRGGGPRDGGRGRNMNMSGGGRNMNNMNSSYMNPNNNMNMNPNSNMNMNNNMNDGGGGGGRFNRGGGGRGFYRGGRGRGGRGRGRGRGVPYGSGGGAVDDDMSMENNYYQQQPQKGPPHNNTYGPGHGGHGRGSNSHNGGRGSHLHAGYGPGPPGRGPGLGRGGHSHGGGGFSEYGPGRGPGPGHGGSGHGPGAYGGHRQRTMSHEDHSITSPSIDQSIGSSSVHGPGLGPGPGANHHDTNSSYKRGNFEPMGQGKSIEDESRSLSSPLGSNNSGMNMPMSGPDPKRPRYSDGMMNTPMHQPNEEVINDGGQGSSDAPPFHGPNLHRHPSIDSVGRGTGGLGPGQISRPGPMNIGGREGRGQGRGPPSSPRRNLPSHSGRGNNFGRGSGPPHQSGMHTGGSGPGPNPGPNNSTHEEQDQFGRKIPPNVRGGPYGGRGHRPFGRMGRGRGGYGRQQPGSGTYGRHSDAHHSDRYGGGGGRGGRLGQRFRSSEHYNSRSDVGGGSNINMTSHHHHHHRHSLGGSNAQNNVAIDHDNQHHKSSSTLPSQKTIPRRDLTPTKQREEVVNVVPPSPPASKPSGLAVELARLSDLTAQMEFQYAKHLQLTKEHEIVKAKVEVLKELPIGFDAFRADLEKLINSDKVQS